MMMRRRLHRHQQSKNIILRESLPPFHLISLHKSHKTYKWWGRCDEYSQ